MEGQHKPVPVLADADQRGPKGCRVAGLADRGAFGRAQLLDLVVGVEFEVLPSRFGIGRDDLHRFVELVAESGDQVGVAGDHRLHRIPEPIRVEDSRHGDVQLHGVHVVGVVGRGVRVEEQPVLQRGQRQHVGDPIPLAQVVDLLLAQPSRRNVGRGQPAAAAAHVRADPGQRVKPQSAQAAQLRFIDGRRRPRPIGIQVRTGVGVDGAGVELHGVR
ncbi:hypothetical protein C1Y40_05046 [Mycobacterium talmoniae]|uniref:Uncharacterized protein n=1 Tax=Mycobacterium talmoniae TaxID=1858794 RepID=A0A2S8BDP9_9MYCO|nr:hypothetical protein C1Y40_05046 [Mycobacterium talmoniae]